MPPPNRLTFRPRHRRTAEHSSLPLLSLFNDDRIQVEAGKFSYKCSMEIESTSSETHWSPGLQNKWIQIQDSLKIEKDEDRR